MKKIQKAFGLLAVGISVFGIAMLSPVSSYAAKVCAATGVVRNLYIMDMNAYNSNIKDWYCYTSGSTLPLIMAGQGNHGYGIYCWCFSGGNWWYSGFKNHDSTTICNNNCSHDCGL